MNNRQRQNAVLNYEAYDHLPVISFGYWDETLSLWQKQGHVTADEIEDFEESEKHKAIITKRLGFDYDWGSHVSAHTEIFPYFPETVLEVYPDGKKKVSDIYGVIVLKSDDITCIPSEINHTLKDRQTWEELYLPRLQYTTDRINYERIEFEKVADAAREQPLGIHCGSMFGEMRNWMGVEGVSYLYADDEELYTEMIDTVGNLSYRLIEEVLKSGIHFDYAHFWEDICFKNGPLVIPNVFREKVGPHYKRIADLLNEHGVNIVSLDCDGLIDSLLPIWLENGVNTMFPIEVGTWGASIKPWREKYGRELRGIGGMDKRVFSKDYVAIDAEIERLKPLVDLGGYLPCPDHRIAPDAKWENVQYYCEQMHKTF